MAAMWADIHPVSAGPPFGGESGRAARLLSVRTAGAAAKLARFTAYESCDAYLTHQGRDQADFIHLVHV